LKRINSRNSSRTNLKLTKNNKLEKFRKVFIKLETCKKLNGRGIETFLSINPPTPKLARSASMEKNLLFAQINLIQKTENSSPLKTYNRREAPIVKVWEAISAH
jgi:hypothetical protein